MVNAISMNTNPLIPGSGDVATPSPAQPKLVPGFDPAGQPLPDAKVWSLKIGSKARGVDTSDGIDGWERRALLQTATKSPQEFLQRLLADSKNGTPVSFNMVRELDVGVLRIAFKADGGQFDTTATIEVFNKKVDGFLKPYMAQDARDKGARAKVTLGVKGELTDAGGVENLQLDVRATNVPRFSAKKLLELGSLEKDLKKALAEDGSQKAKQDKVLGLVNDAVQKLSDIPLPFLMKLIGDSDVIKAELTSKGHDGRASVKVGQGKYSVGLRDVLGKGKDEPDVRFALTGQAKDKDTLQVDELRVYNHEKLAVSFEGSQPTLSRVNKKGEREVINDHLGEVLVYLPMALALAGDKKIF